MISWGNCANSKPTHSYWAGWQKMPCHERRQHHRIRGPSVLDDPGTHLASSRIRFECNRYANLFPLACSVASQPHPRITSNTTVEVGRAIPAPMTPSLFARIGTASLRKLSSVSAFLCYERRSFHGLPPPYRTVQESFALSPIDVSLSPLCSSPRTWTAMLMPLPWCHNK